MPGKRWSSDERKVLRNQLRAGTPLAKTVIAHRTTLGIVYQLRRLKLYPSCQWKSVEVRLLRKMAKSGKPPWMISVAGRSSLAVRNKMLRMKLWRPKPRATQLWLREELKLLEHLVVDCGYTARQAVGNGYFPGRTIDSVAQQMRRRGWKRIASQRGR